jgi:hypothetical protein
VWLLVEQQKQQPQVKEEVDNKLKLPGIVERDPWAVLPAEGDTTWDDKVTGTSGIQPGYTYEGDKKDANYPFKNVTDAITKISSR